MGDRSLAKRRYMAEFANLALPLQTPSLVLRRFVPEDAQAMMELNGEPSTRNWLPSHFYETIAEAVAALAYLIGQYSSPGNPKAGAYVLGVADRDSGRLLGHVGFSPLGGDVEVSFAISEGARGHGYGTEALGHACLWAAQSFAIDEIVAVTASANVLSRHTLARASFVHASDEVMRFQGTEQPVSRYVWRARKAK